MVRIVVACLACLLWAAQAQAEIQNIFISKIARYTQTSESTILPLALPYVFHGEVRGQNLQGMAPPTLAGPINYGVIGTFSSNGALTYTAPSWYFAPQGATEWSFGTLAALDAAFGDGTYTFNVGGTTYPLNLSGDAFPNPPRASLSGGAWVNGRYVIDPSMPLTITTDPFTDFTSHRNGIIQVYYADKLRSLFANAVPPPANVMSFTIPGGTFLPNQEHPINVVFTAIMDNGGGPGGASSVYYSHSLVTVYTGAASSAQVSLRKVLKYVQTSATDIVDDAANAAVFHAGVDGPDIAGIPAPTVTGPFNVGAIGPAHNGGVLMYNAGNGGWRYGASGRGFATSSAAQLNTLFPDGTYTFNVKGASIALALSGNGFPHPAPASLTGGTWSNGSYEVPRDRPLTITTGPFGGYGAHPDDAICVWLSGPGFVAEDADIGSCPGALQQARSTAGNNTLSYTLPSNTLASGQQYALNVFFYSVVDSAAGSGSNAGYVAHMRVPLKATEPPFRMTVTSSITPATASASAQIQFRPEDVGKQGSIYVFAVAPAAIVKDAFAAKRVPGDPFAGYSWMSTGEKDAVPVQCVLAQLSSSGQLVGVSASSLQAYVSGVLSAQGAAVTILNGVPTVNIGGATFYVGYGTSAAAMLNGGLNRSAVTVPGAPTCQPKPPQTGWWWNPLEPGRGFSVEVQGNHLFFASFLYDASGRSTWYVASGPVSLDGTLFTDVLYSAKGGQSLGGAYPGFPQLANEGPVTLSFSSATNGAIVWPGGAVPMQRFPMVPNGLAMSKVANAPESGWWWNAAESGRGFFMEWQGNTLDIAGYVYDEQGNPIWVLTYLIADGAGAVDQPLTGSWWTYGDGQTLTGAYKPNRQITNNFAPLTLKFTGPTTAVMTLPNGRSTTLTRQQF